MSPPSTLIASTNDSNTCDSTLLTILNSLDALVYVSDMINHELIFLNDYGRRVWGEPGTKLCWQYLQKNQQGPCDFCTNPKLLDASNQATGVVVWEYFNEAVERWFQCRDEAIRWPDGRWVRIQIATDITERKQTEEDLHKARRYAEYLADTDTLTSLNNRRAFFRAGELLLEQAQRSNQPLSLIMFDLDHFKQINDRWGHARGDAVLKQVAAIASRSVRESDLLARIGGEEFAILLPHSSADNTLLSAERLRSAIADASISAEEHAIHISASLGVACIDEAHKLSLSELINLADNALYTAKHNGRNRCALATPDNGHKKSRIS